MANQTGIPSVRNLTDSDLGTVLRKFTGIFDSMPTEDKSFGDASKGEKVRNATIVHLNFKDIEIIETTEPYNFPTVTVDLSLSNRTKSKYGVFGKSVAELLDMQYTKDQLNVASPAYIPPDKRANLDSCLGRRLGLVMADGEAGRPAAPMLFDGRAVDDKNPRGKDVPTPCWTCYMIEGIGVAGGQGITPNDRAYQLLDGRTAQQFKQEAIKDTIIRNDGGLMAMISAPDASPTAFANVAVNSGLFTKDAAGVYHKK